MNANTELAKTALLMVMFKSIGKVNEVEQLRVVIDSTIQKQDLEAQLKLCADREVSESTLSALRDNINSNCTRSFLSFHRVKYWKSSNGRRLRRMGYKINSKTS